LGNVVVEICRGGFMLIGTFADAMLGGCCESATVAVKAVLIADVGVPERAPFLPSIIPGGRLPEVTLQA
jgi:hypothetical protein